MPGTTGSPPQLPEANRRGHGRHRGEVFFGSYEIKVYRETGVESGVSLGDLGWNYGVSYSTIPEGTIEPLSINFTWNLEAVDVVS